MGTFEQPAHDVHDLGELLVPYAGGRAALANDVLVEVSQSLSWSRTPWIVSTWQSPGA